jgi:hypothetical protein
MIHVSFFATLVSSFLTLDVGLSYYNSLGFPFSLSAQKTGEEIICNQNGYGDNRNATV